MKRLLLALAIIAFFCAGGHAQLRPSVKPQLMPYSYYQFPGYLQVDSGILVPVRTPSFTPKRRGTLVYNTADSTPNYWSGYSWFPMASQSWANKLFYSTATFDTSSRVLSLVNGSGTTSLVIPRGGNVGGLSSLSYSRAGDMINILGDNGASVRFSLRDGDSSSRMLYSDTTAMLTGYARSGQVVKYSDTAAQVSNLLRKSDTSSMLSGYGRSGQLVKYSDTAAQLTGYARSGQVVKYSDTTAQLSNYRRKTTIIENSDLRNSTISGVSLGNSLSSLSWGYGFTSGTSYNGSSAVSQGLDTTAVSTKANVTALLLGKQNLIGYTPENAANKGAANGYAPLGSDVKIATTYLPAITMNNVYSASSQSAMLSLSAVVGDMCVRTDSSISYVLQVAAPSNPAAWVKVLSPAAPVSSVNGKTGVVSLLTSDISEGGTSYFWTAARSRAAQSSSIAAISYDNSTGTFSLVAGYYIPSTTDQSNWNVAYNRRLSSASLSASTLTLTLADASTVTASVPTFNQNTTGNAATATLAANSTLWNGKAINTSSNPSAVASILSYDNSNAEFRPATAAQVQSFIGLTTSNWVDIASSQTITGTKTFGGAASIGAWLASSSYAWFGYYSQNNSSNYALIQSSTGVTILNSVGTLYLRTGGTDNLTITSSLATFSGGGTFGSQVYAPSFRSGQAVFAGDGSGEFDINYNTGYSGSMVYFGGGTTAKVTITSSGSITASNNITSSGFFSTNSRTYFTPGAARIESSNYTLDFAVTSSYASLYTNYYSGGSNIPLKLGALGYTDQLVLNTSGNVSSSGTITASAFYESSDIRLKRLHIIENSKDGINAIQYTFRPSGKDKWGYSAQQVRKILPYAVTTGEDGFLKVDYTTVHTFKIMKLEKRIEELEQLTRKLLLQQIQSPKGN